MASGNFTVVFDACVLYPAALRDFLMTLATAGLFRAKWTDDIHDEWISALAERRPELGRDRLTLVRQKMDEALPDALIERERYEALIPSLSLPDVDDRHVLAAAIVAGAEIIVTFNLVDFPPASLTKHAVEAVRPDEFVLGLIDLDEERVIASLEAQRRRLKKPTKTTQELLETLAQRGLKGTAKRLLGHLP